MARDSGQCISTDELLKAYTLGYFPMARARDDDDVIWVLPETRGILRLQDFRAPRRLKRFLKSHPFEIRINTAFADVIHACAETTPARPDTWINDSIIEAYTELHHIGIAHSVECWRDKALVGGLYGLSIGAAYCGESMFSRETNASKVAFLYLAAMLKESDFQFIDAQFFNEHLEQFGLIEIDNDQYQYELSTAIELPRCFPLNVDQFDRTRILQSITQTS